MLGRQNMIFGIWGLCSQSEKHFRALHWRVDIKIMRLEPGAVGLEEIPLCYTAHHIGLSVLTITRHDVIDPLHFIRTKFLRTNFTAPIDLTVFPSSRKWQNFWLTFFSVRFKTWWQLSTDLDWHKWHTFATSIYWNGVTQLVVVV